MRSCPNASKNRVNDMHSCASLPGGRKVSIITSERYVVGWLGEPVKFSLPDAASGNRETVHRIGLCLTVGRAVLCLLDSEAKFLLQAFTRCTLDRIL